MLKQVTLDFLKKHNIMKVLRQNGLKGLFTKHYLYNTCVHSLKYLAALKNCWKGRRKNFSPIKYPCFIS